jgi:hypothetical protein
MSKKLAKSIMESFTRTLFSVGHLNEADLQLSKEEFYKKIIDKSELSITIDHRSNIIDQANAFLVVKKFDFAKIFYAMFFEHSLNKIIEHECTKRNFDIKTKTDIIRSVDIYGKLTWLPKIFGNRTFNVSHMNTIKKLSDDRNSFIHYKWKPEADGIIDSAKETKGINEEIRRIKLAVRYMKNYETHILFEKKKNKLIKKLNQ